MAWIESHQDLRLHYKTKRLARELKVTVAAAIGHLHLLWWWAVDFAPDGDLTKFDDYEIADAIMYEGKDPSRAKAALITAGFLDNSNDGTVTIHDWYDYAGKTLEQRDEKRRKDRERQARSRSRTAKTLAAQGTTECDTAAVTGEVTGENGACHAPVTRDTQADSGRVAVLPNITEHNITEQDSTEQDTTPPIPPASGGMGAGVEPDAQERRFDEFWTVYPKKVGKGAAQKAWKKIKPDKALFDRIMTSLRDNVQDNADWERDGGQYIPNPATWLNEKRWDDVIPRRKSARGGGTNAGGRTERIGGADSYHDFQRSTGFRSADSGADADG